MFQIMNVQPRTCIVYDPIFLEHIPNERVESPERIKAIKLRLDILGLQILQPRSALDEEILRCHTIKYLKLLKREIPQSTESIEAGYSRLSTGDTCVCPASLNVAYMAAGSVSTAIDALMAGRAKNVFCNIRPPGHHAGIGTGMGFCIFNNAAIGAKYAQAVYKLERILIVDWDVHRGNGTQEIFFNDRSIYTFGFHQSAIYPDNISSVSKFMPKFGRSFSITKDPKARLEILEIFKRELPAQMAEFQPQLVLISAGFDAHHHDPLGQLNLTDEDFVEMTKSVMAVANLYAGGRIVSVLEGGYNPTGTANAAFAHVKTLMEA